MESSVQIVSLECRIDMSLQKIPEVFRKFEFLIVGVVASSALTSGVVTLEAKSLSPPLTFSTIIRSPSPITHNLPNL